MIDRDALVEAVSREVFARTNRGKPNDGWSGPDDWRIIEKITGYYIDAIEPRVREDMDWHQKVNAESAVALMQWRDELQAKVEALDHAWDCDADKPRGAGMPCDCLIRDVLPLIKDDDQ